MGETGQSIAFSADPHVTQENDRELKGWARSIDSLFAELEAEEVVEDQSASPEEPELEAEAAASEPAVESAEPEAEASAPEPVVESAEPEAEAPAPEPEVGLPQPEVEAEELATVPEIEPEAVSEGEPRSSVELQLEETTSRYLMATSDQRKSLTEPLRAAVEEARSANALDGLARAMNALLVQPVPDPAAEALAGELMNVVLRMRMAIRLGSVRDERERLALVDAYAKLGDPMATAIADALTETDDRLARKIYVGALVALGQSGMRVVEGMLEDSRWFVARNGVAVLGESGEETAIAHLTGTLAHEDMRVRRETVLSLAKIGGEDAAQLVVGMLNDSEADVRTAAARAVSVLKVDRAFKLLLSILEVGDDDPVIEQVLRALGQLGDPAAVALIEKRAVGSLFYKPSPEVRLAALSALGSIGTPHAMSVVEAAKDDKDPDIRVVVQQILAAR